MAARPATGAGREWTVELVGGPCDGEQFVVRTLGRWPPPDILVPLPTDPNPRFTAEPTPPSKPRAGRYAARSYLFGGQPDTTSFKYDWKGEI